MDDLSGNGWVTFGTPGAGVGQFNKPGDILVDENGRVYVADEYNGRLIRMNDMSGSGWVEFNGTADHSIVIGMAHGVALSPSGRIYIVDNINSQVIRMDDMNGTNAIAYGLPGGAADGPGHFNAPKSIVVLPRA